MESRLFSDVAQDKVFYLKSGKPIRNISELIYSLKAIDNEEFSHHANFEKDDFATWISDAVGDKALGSNLRNIKDRKLYIEYLEKVLNPKTDKSSNISDVKKLPSLEIIKTSKKTDSKVKKEKKPEIKPKLIKINTVPKKSSTIIAHSKSSDSSSKEISRLQSEIDKITKLNSELNSKIDAISKLLNSKDALEPQIQNTVAKNVSKYFDDKEFRKKILEIFKSNIKEDIESVHSKDRHVIKSEINSIISMNNELEKKLDSTIAHRNKQIEEAIKNGVSQVIESKIDHLNGKIDKIFENKLSKLDATANKRSTSIVQNNISKFKKDVESEKHDLRHVASDVMHKEFTKLLNEDDQVSKLVIKYQKMFSEGVDHTSKVYKDAADKFNDELTGIKDKIVLEAFHNLNKNLSDTIKKQREVLDSELTKTLNSNKFFLSRFEKEVLHREKLLLDSADRKLNENYNKHNLMLNSEYKKYGAELKDLTNELGKNIKNTENNLINSINSKVHESINKEFNDVVINQREELNKALNNSRLVAIESINKEFAEILSRHKSVLIDKFSKSEQDQKKLAEEFRLQLKSEKDNILSEVKDTMQKDLMIAINNQRDILDKELAKTISSNKFFIDRFEKDIATITTKLHDEADKVFESKYLKHAENLKTAHMKQIEQIKAIIKDADQSFGMKESQIFEKLNSIINTNVRQAVNTEFTRLIDEEKQALQKELVRAQEFNNTMEQKFENSLKLKEEELIKNVTDETNSRFNDIIAEQEQRLGKELTDMKKSYTELENKKKDILEKSTDLFNHVSNYSKVKLKSLDKEYDKHMKKASKLSTLIMRTEKALEELKELKEDLKREKKDVSKDLTEYNELINNLHNIKATLEEETGKIKAVKSKSEAYNLIAKCQEYINSKDIANVKNVYDQIIGIYNNSKDFDKKDRVQLYKDIQVLLSKIRENFSGMIEPTSK